MSIKFKFNGAPLAIITHQHPYTCHIITPRACARGKAIGLYVCCRCRCRCRCRPQENRQFGRSRPLSDL